METQLNYLDEIIEPEHKASNPTKTLKEKKERLEQKFNTQINSLNEPDKSETKEEKLEYVLQEYEYKINKTNVFNLNSLAQEKKIKTLIASKKALLKKLKNNRKDIELQTRLKIASKYQADAETNKLKTNIFENLHSKYKRKKIDTRNKKARERALKIKKVKKQVKKKSRSNKCFINYDNFGEVNYKKFFKNMDIVEWRLFIERQLMDILDPKFIDIDQMSKNLIYEIEQIENNRKEISILQNLDRASSVKLEDFTIGTKASEKTHVFEKKQAIGNPSEFKMTDNDKEHFGKKEHVSIYFIYL